MKASRECDFRALPQLLLGARVGTPSNRTDLELIATGGWPREKLTQPVAGRLILRADEEVLVRKTILTSVQPYLLVLETR